MQFTLQDLLGTVNNAQMTANAEVRGLTTDSRKAGAGDVFVALRGEQFDAHDFLPQVAAAGAAAVIAEKLPAGFTLPALLVPDSKMALAEVARFWRQKFTLPVIGVTGSNGKTTVKEMIASILAAAFGADGRLATTGNLNNEIGVPLTIMQLHSGHQAAVIEMGMNHPGEIALLASAARPTVALVNNAQREHQEFMQTVEAVARENGVAIQSLPDDGVAVFPAGDEYSALWQSFASEHGQRKTLTFGLTDDADVHATYQPSVFGSDLQVKLAGRDLAIRLQAAGQHNVLNALAAAACCHAIGVSHEAIVSGLENFAPVNGRLQRKQAACGATVIDDSYNANPDSVRAAIDVLAQIAGDTILVLGDMGEVGDNGAQFHQEIGEYARQRGIKQLLLLGDLVTHTALGYGEGARHFADIDSLLNALDSCVQAETTVLVKGSRFMKMERAVAHLVTPGGTNTLQQKIIGNH
ncbi:UDP-N-acetylmuramoyl-tripeptide--D-alanyl-D-alanine ligase [Undibacterium sp. TS12]|uniref:UDP-N-acetylmuramoyl-tripeptide--D-alanyl-D- alanine ligase n=1 Tax=Undibacterium sp. TS12 TaxID=2908202 RepID=UPI001F4CD1CF|nr:UDP-N-acetylmuramoyl-tripeptide--D-alanyl-D-alanine ligase [Undibacterium sp. TS12]MCH8620212.1 UDP-N-acetylmuramoyl-tripeptide--D-alanyl-D-alanine ligase [Undibacterium sp. TS12]